MEKLGDAQWTGNTPKIYLTSYYEYYRDGATMMYRVKLSIGSVTGINYFGYPIYARVYMDGGEKFNVTLKNASPSQWNYTIEYTSDWYPVYNKTSGTTSVAINLYSGNGSSRNETYYYDMYVAPAYPYITAFTVYRRDETSVTFSFSADSNLDYAWYSKDGGNSWYDLPTSNIVSGLSNNTSYNFKLKVRRADSGLTSESAIYTQSTYDYPYCTESPNFNIEDRLTLKFYNPLSRTIKITLIGADGTERGTDTTNSTSIYGYSDANWVDWFYKTIPNAMSGRYKVKVTYGSVVRTRDNGNTYSVVESKARPSFSDFDYIVLPPGVDEDDIYASVTNDDKTIIQDYSTVKIKISNENKATPTRYSPIAKYQVVIGNMANYSTSVTSNPVEISLSKVFSDKIEVYAVDTRGIKSATISKTAPFLDYFRINIKSVSLERNNGGVGTGVYAVVNGEFWNKKFSNIITNKATLKEFYYKKTSETTWKKGIIPVLKDSSVTINTYTYSSNLIGDLPGEGFNIEYSYDLKFVVNDLLYTYEYTTILGSGKPLIAKHKNGMAINGSYDETLGGAFQINGDAYIDKIPITHHIITGKEVPTNDFVDGRRVYAKRINFGNLPNNTSKSVSTGLIHKDIQVIKMEGTAQYMGTVFNLVSPRDNPNFAIYCWLSESNELTIQTGTDRSAYTAKVTIYYTKFIEGVDYILGDINGDGIITQKDLELLQNLALSTTPLSMEQIKVADVNRDGVVDMTDAAKLQAYLNGKITEL